jgi:hypothetical protein
MKFLIIAIQRIYAYYRKYEDLKDSTNLCKVSKFLKKLCDERWKRIAEINRKKGHAVGVPLLRMKVLNPMHV